MTDQTLSVHPWRGTPNAFPVSASHIRIVLSFEPDTMRVPSGEIATDQRRSVCPWRGAPNTLLVSASHIRFVLSNWATFAVPEFVAWPVFCSGAGSAGGLCSNNDQIQCMRRVRITPAWRMWSGIGWRVLELEPTGAGLGARPAPRTEIFLISRNSFLRDGRGPLSDRICDGWGEDSCKDIITNNQQLWDRCSIPQFRPPLSCPSRLINGDLSVFASTATSASS